MTSTTVFYNNKEWVVLSLARSSYPLTGNDLKYQVIFCKSVDRVRDATWQPGCVLLWFSARAIKSGRLRQSLVRALSTAGIQSCMNCALHFGTMFMLHWKSMPTFRSFLLLHAFCMVLLNVREIHDVKTLNSELRSNSQLSACILYGTTSTVEKMTWYIGSFLLQ